jgi:hypothetical protein
MSNLGSRRSTHLKVSEEGVHEQVADDERRENGIDQPHEEEAAFEAGTRYDWFRSLARQKLHEKRHSRLDQLLLVPFCQERPPDLPIAAEQEPQQAEPEVPLQRLSQHALPEPLLPRPFAEQAPDRSLQESRNRQRDVEQVFVEQGDEVVLLSHDAVRDVVRVQALDGDAGVRAGAGGECGRVSGAQSGQAGDDGVPRDRLDVALHRRYSLSVIAVEIAFSLVRGVPRELPATRCRIRASPTIFGSPCRTGRPATHRTPQRR